MIHVAQFLLRINCTDKTPNKNSEIDLFAFEDRTIAPLKIPNLGYFKNDVLSWPITVVNY